jgi:large subunit ribosomal protein L24
MACVTEQHKFKIRRDDTVEVIAGKDKGKRGRVLRIIRGKDRVVVEGLNIVKKAQKKRSQQDRGGIIEVEAALHASNVMIICKKCGKPVRIGYKIEGGKKSRVCKKCGEAL